MPEGIGNIRPTLIPSLTEVADIQTAFRLYHYGSTSVPGSIASASNTSVVGIIRDLTIDDLKDVVITSAATGQTIVYNGTNWINALADGDISAVSSGTGIVITGGTGPIPSIAVDTTLVATTSNTMTLTNKTLVAPTLQNPSVTGGIFVAGTFTSSPTITNPTINNPSVTSGTFITPTIATPSVTGSITITSPAVITSTSATSAILFSSTVTDVAIGSSTIRTTAFPASGTTSTATVSAGYMGMPQNSATTGAYRLQASDAGTHIYSTATRTITIPGSTTGGTPQVNFPIGSTIVFINASGTTLTIQMDGTSTDTCLLAGVGTSMTGGSGSRTLAAFGFATLVKITATSWIISGNGLT